MNPRTPGEEAAMKMRAFARWFDAQRLAQPQCYSQFKLAMLEAYKEGARAHDANLEAQVRQAAEAIFPRDRGFSDQQRSNAAGRILRELRGEVDDA